MHPLEGIWHPLRAELAGAAAPELVLQRTEVTFAAGRYAVRFAGEIADAGTYRLDPAPPGRSLRLTSTSGPHEGRIIPCLFQLAGDRLRICYGLDGVEPTDFTAPPESPRYLVTYRRG